MNRLLKVFWCAGLLALLPVWASAQTATVTKKVRAPLYDTSKEVTLEGNVSKVTTFMPGSIPGGHLVVFTPKGIVDGHLGPYALSGRNGVSIPAGTHVKLAGVMSTIRGNPVFLVRTIDTGTVKYTIRSEHGFPLIQGAVQPARSIHFVSSKGGR
jgi:hypothetical protein